MRLHQIKMLSFLCLLGLFCPVQAQVQNTIYQTLATASSATGTIIFGPVTNIGQSFHQVNVLLSTSGGCIANASQDYTVTLLGNNTNSSSSNIVRFGQTVLSDINYKYNVVEGVGAYPFVFVEIKVQTLVGCTYSVFYSGSVQPIAPVNLRTGYMLNAIYSGAIGNTIIVAASTLRFYSTVNWYQVQVSATADTALNINCGMTTLATYNLRASELVNLPYTQLSYFRCATGTAINIDVSAASTVTLTVAFTIERGLQLQ